MTTSHRPALMRALLLGVSAVTMTTMVAAPAAAQTSTGTIAGREIVLPPSQALFAEPA